MTDEELRHALMRRGERGEPRGAELTIAAARKASDQHGVHHYERSHPGSVRQRALFGLLAAAAAVVVLTGALYVRAAPLRGSTPATTSGALRSEDPNARLLWIDQDDAGVRHLHLADADTGTTSVRAWVAGPLLRIGTQGYTFTGRSLQRVDPRTGSVEDMNADTSDGEGSRSYLRLFPHTTNDSVYVGATSDGSILNSIELRATADGALLGGPWTLPAGYELPETARPDAEGVLLQTVENANSHALAVWTPTTGKLRPLGNSWMVLDSFTPANRTSSMVAWLPGNCLGGECDLQLTDTSSGSTRSVAVPAGYFAFFGGGAFSPDGTKLAAFVAYANPSVNPRADLVIIDVRTRSVTTIEQSTVQTGEPYGFAVWTPDGRWLFFGGLDDPLRVHRSGTRHAALTRFPASYGLAVFDQSGRGA